MLYKFDVLPLAELVASFIPANSSTFLITAFATNPNPLGAGFNSTLTLPVFPFVLNGIECFVPHAHSHEPHPFFTDMICFFYTFISFFRRF